MAKSKSGSASKSSQRAVSTVPGSSESYGMGQKANISLASAYGMGQKRLLKAFGKIISDSAYGLSQVTALKGSEGSRIRLIRQAFERELSDFFGEEGAS